MKCFQIEIKYINENGQPVQVTIISDPVPIVTDINKDNENEVISDILNYIYDNPQAQGYDELMSVLENATSMSQVNLYDRPLNYVANKGVLNVPNKELSSLTLKGLFKKFSNNTNKEVVSLLSNLVKDKEVTSPFKVNIKSTSFGKVIDPVMKTLIDFDHTLMDNNYITAFYDDSNNTIYVANDGIVRDLDLQKAIVNFLISGKYKDSIESIIAQGLEFNPLDIVPADKLSTFLNLLSSFKPKSKIEELTSNISTAAVTHEDNEIPNAEEVKKFQTNNEDYIYFGKIEGEDVKTLANPFVTSEDFDLRHTLGYWSWLRGLPMPTSVIYGGSVTGVNTSDLYQEQRQYIQSLIDNGELDKHIVLNLTNNLERTEKDQRDAQVLLDYLNDIRNPKRLKTRETKFIKKLNSFISTKTDEPLGEYLKLKNFKGVNRVALSSWAYEANSTMKDGRLSDLEFKALVILSDLIRERKDDEIDFQDFLAMVLPKSNEKQAKSSELKSVTARQGDVVEYAGNQYLLWEVTKLNKAKLMKSDGTKYTGTPDMSKIQFVSSTATFEFNGSKYTTYGDSVFSLSTGSKIKHAKILEKAALARTRAASGENSPRFSKSVNANTITYPKDDASAFNAHKSYLKQIGAQPDGTVYRSTATSKDSIYELEQIHKRTINIYGHDAVGNIKYETDNYGNDTASFKMAIPSLSPLTKQELDLRVTKELEFKARLLNSNVNSPSKKWDELTPQEKQTSDSERYDNEAIEEIYGPMKWKDSEGNDTSFSNYFRYSDEISADSLLELIYEHKKSPFVKRLLDDFKDMLSKIPVKLERNKPYLKKEENLLTLGTYFSDEKRIVLSNFKSSFLNSTQDSLAVHEILHAITAIQLSRDTQATNELNDLLEYARLHMADSYPLSDIDEFLTGIYTDLDFRTQLETVPFGEKTLFGKILDFFSNLLNFGEQFKNDLVRIFKAVGVQHSEKSLREEAVKRANNVLNEIKSEPYGYRPKTQNTFKTNINKSFRISEDYINGSLLHTTNDDTVNNDINLRLDDSDRSNIKKLGDFLSQSYGLPIEFMNSNEIDKQYSKGGIQYGRHRAFVEDGVIVINTDYATVAEPIHELSHLILDGLKITNNTLYQELLDIVKTHPTYNYVQRVYPELTGDQIAEETFVTVLGERYSDVSEPVQSEAWNAENKSFFNRVIRAIKSFFADVFGIDNHRFHALQDAELMNLDLNTILDDFANKVLSGDFIKEVDLATKKEQFLKSNTYLKSPDGGHSSLHMALTSNGISEDMATKIWMKSKTENFYNWHRGDLVEEFDEEPRIFYRDSNGNLNLSPTDENSEPVVVKGNSILQEIAPFTYKTASVNVRSVYNLDNGTIDNFKYTGGIENYSSLNNIKLIGTPSELSYSISKLKEIFADYTFAVQSFGSVDYIEYYKSPTREVAQLRNFLLKYSTKTC